MLFAGRIETNWCSKVILQQKLLYDVVVSIRGGKTPSLLDHRGNN